MNIDLAQGIILYLILLVSLSVHEWAHAFSAEKLGDPTARSMGRVTLNPISHIDPIGTVLIPLFMIFVSPGFFIIGWGKPVPVDPRYFKNRMQGDIVVSMAGPFSNFLICIATVIVGGILLRFAPSDGLFLIISLILMMNCVLMIFNLIPIPPLDGSHVMKYIVKMREETYFNLARYGFIILIVLINIPAFRQILGTAISTAMGIFLIGLDLIAGFGSSTGI